MAAQGLTVVRDRIAAAAARAGRDAAEITLVAVSKGQSLSAVEAAYAAGHRDFGENRAEELTQKAPLLPPDIRWHFVGALQSRKARLVRPLTTLLHSLDRASLVRAWVRDADHPPPALVEVNLAAEPQKGGVPPDALGELLELATESGVECRGLMAIPPQPDTADDSRRWFAALAALRERWRPDFPTLTELSMGMTDDYEVAIESGATLIRVGRAIFGPRDGGGPARERGT